MPKVTEEHVEARRRQILSAALACFAREGFHRTTMQDIFREAELSPGAVYSYFKGKDEIIDGITTEALRFASEGARSLAERAGGDAPPPTIGEVFEQIARGFADFDIGTYEARTRVAPQLWVEAQRNPSVGKRARAGIGGIVEAYTKLAKEAGHADPEARARAAVSLFQGLLVQRSLFGDKVDADAYIVAGRAMLDAPT